MRKTNFSIGENSQFYDKTVSKDFIGRHRHNMSVNLSKRKDQKCNFVLGTTPVEYRSVTRAEFEAAAN